MNSTNSRIPQILFLLFVFFVSLVFFGLIRGFSLGIFWAIVLSILFGDRYSSVLNYFNGKKNLAAAITTIGIVLIVIIPVALLSTAVINEAIGTAEKVQSEEFNLQDKLSRLQVSISPYLERLGLPTNNIQATFNKLAQNYSSDFGSRVLGLTQNIFGSLIQIAIMLYVLFFFLRDGKEIRKLIIKNFPMLDSIEHRLINRFQNVAKATVKGSLLIAILQGVCGGILFLAVGVKGAILWGTLMILASLLPIGGAIIWGPIGAIYILQGSYGKGIIVLAVGGLLIGLLDNVLRPRLVGNDTKLPDYIVLISTLGGITYFGISGFVLGPVIAALFITCWQMMGEIYGKQTHHQ